MRYVLFILSILVFLDSSAFSAPVAKVNGIEISTGELSASLSQLSEFQKKDLLSNQGSKEKLIMDLVDQEILAQEAKKLKIHETENFKSSVKLFERQYLALQMSERHLNTKLTEEAQQAYYEKYKVRFSLTAQVRAQHILVKTEKEAQAILPQATKKGAQFGALAEQYSQDPTVKINRGDLGYFTRDKMVPEFSDAVFSAKKGSVIGPIQTSLGYHIVKLIDRKPGVQLPYGDVKLTVKNMLEQDLRKQWLHELKAQSKIEVKF